METNWNYIDVYPVLIEKLTDVNIFKDKDGLFFTDNPKTIDISIKGYELVLVRTDQCCFDSEYSIEYIKHLNKHDKDFFEYNVVSEIVAGQKNIPLEYILKFIEQYNSNTVKNIRIESAEYFDHNIGDKIRVIKPNADYKEGDIITITGFDCNRIFFEEDNEDNQGIHISYLDIKTFNDAKFDNNNKIIILEKEDESDERKYTLKELKDFANKAWLDGTYGYSNFENFFEEAFPEL